MIISIHSYQIRLTLNNIHRMSEATLKRTNKVHFYFTEIHTKLHDIYNF